VTFAPPPKDFKAGGQLPTDGNEAEEADAPAPFNAAGMVADALLVPHPCDCVRL
jgi:hypothetical protein